MSGIGLTVIKKFQYRGNDEEWSNHYHLEGAIPADAAAWRTLFDALVAQEKNLYPSGTSVVAGYGYDDDAANAHAVWSVDLEVAPNSPVAGSMATTGGHEAQGDGAVWIRWKLDRENSRGKSIYLRKYYHGAIITDGSFDAVLPAQGTALASFGTALENGTVPGVGKIRDAGGGAIVSTGHSTWVTTRTLKRRGKRPPT
jgi:hypothetical protein